MPHFSWHHLHFVLKLHLLTIVQRFALSLTVCLASFAQAQTVTYPSHFVTTWTNLAYTTEYIYNLDMHATWLQEPLANEYGSYAMFWFTFKNGTGGYMGLQKDDYEGKKLIFSIWDAGTGTTKTAMPLHSNCIRFDWEGNGTSCIYKNFQWKAGVEYKLRIWRSGGIDNKETWGGWIINMATKEETMIGHIELTGSNAQPGYGGLATNHANTLEYYKGKVGITCNQLPYFGMEWTGPYMNNGQAMPISHSTVYKTGVGTDTCSNVSVTALRPGTFRQEIAPQTLNGKASAGQALWSQTTMSNLNRIDCVLAWAERQYPTMFDNADRKPRRLSQWADNGTIRYRDYRYSPASGWMLGADTITQHLFLSENGGPAYPVGRTINDYLNQSGCR